MLMERHVLCAKLTLYSAIYWILFATYIIVSTYGTDNVNKAGKYACCQRQL